MKNIGLWFGIAFLVISVICLATAFQYEYYTEQGPGPGMLPRGLSAILLVLSLCFIRESVRKPIPFSDILNCHALKKSGLILVYSIGFTVLLKYIGFVADTAMLLFLLLRQQFRWSAALVIAIGVAGSLFWFFEGFLQLPLPVNSFGW